MLQVYPFIFVQTTNGSCNAKNTQDYTDSAHFHPAAAAVCKSETIKCMELPY